MTPATPYSLFWSLHDPVERADRRSSADLHGHSVRHRLLWRSPRRAHAAKNSRLGLQPVTGRVLHQLDVFRCGGSGRRAAVVISADLPGADHHSGLHPLGAAENGDDQQTGKHHLDCGLYRRALRQIPDVGRGGGTGLPGRRIALYRLAAQRHRAWGQPAQRRRRRRQWYWRSGHRIDRLTGAGTVHNIVRHAQPGCHRAPPRHGPGNCFRVTGQVAGLPRRRHVCDLRLVQRFWRLVQPGQSQH